jgi:dCMP deaminase
MISHRDVKWMELCVVGAQTFSTCGKRKYMAIIVDRFGHQVGSGYNGGPKGSKHCVDGGCPRLYEGSPNGSSYDNCIAIHSEANALLHSNYVDYRDGGTMYVNGPPCFSCAKLIANSGLARVVYMEDSAYADTPRVLAFLRDVGVMVEEIAMIAP